MFISSKFMTELSMRKRSLNGKKQVIEQRLSKNPFELEVDSIKSIFKEKGIYEEFLADQEKAKQLDDKLGIIKNILDNFIKYCKLVDIEVPNRILDLLNK